MTADDVKHAHDMRSSLASLMTKRRRRLSITTTALANVGPGLGPEIGPAGNFSGLNDAAKALLTVAMLLGRLELLSVLVILTPAFWRA